MEKTAVPKEGIDLDSIAYFVGQKGRIPAFLFSISCNHPDLLEFIDAKKDFTVIQNANISVQCTNEFYNCVELDKEWLLSFEVSEIKKGQRVWLDSHSIDSDCILCPKKNKYYYIAKRDRKEQKIEKKYPARLILELIAKGMTLYGEPGIQNISTARKYSNSDYVYDSKSNYDTRILSSNACVTGDTEVLTRNGYKKIDEILDENIEIWNGFEWSLVKPYLTNKDQTILEIEFSDGRKLKCTKYHKFFIINGYINYKRISDPVYNSRTKQIEARSLKINDKIIKYSFPLLDFKKSLNDPYTKGFFAADGLEGSNSIWLYEPKYDLLKHLNYKKTNSEKLNQFGTKSKQVILNCEIKNKFHVPIKYNLKSRLEWLSGYFDGDGTELNEGGIQAVSVNLQFLQNIQKLLSTLGINSKICFGADAAYRSLPNGLGGYKDYWCQTTNRICISAQDVQTLVNLGLNCHRLILNKTPNRNASRFTQVVSIKKLKNKENVYCFNENKRHTAVFNGLLTGQCSEQYLSRESLCVLASLNAEKFSIDNTSLKQELETIGTSVSRFLDNVNECELVYQTYATPHQKLAIEQLRRIGAGYTNLAAWLFKNNLEYGSEDGNKRIEYFTKWYNFYLYKNSIELGKEKGNFGAFSRKKIEESPFIKRMIKLGLEFSSLRNVTNSSIAPTGTLSLMFRDGIFSYGIEPAFGMYFWKRTRISGKYEYYFCVPNIVRKVFKEHGIEIPMSSDTISDTWDGKHGKKIAEFIDLNKNKLGIKFVNATEVDPLKKLDLMSKVMKWIDSSISVTYLLPEGSDWKDVYNFIIEANKKEVKSIAAFPDRKMYGIVTFIPFKDLAIKLTNEGLSIPNENFSADEINELKTLCSLRVISNEKIISRPKEVPCDVHHVSVKGQPYFILLGIVNGNIYEIFAGKNGVLDHKIKSGKIVKMKRPRQYKFIGEDESELTPISAFSDNEQQAITRLISIALQAGTPIDKIITQLDKTDGDLTSFSKAVIKSLKKYIQDGTNSINTCPECKSGLIYSENCLKCQNCGWSRC